MYPLFLLVFALSGKGCFSGLCWFLVRGAWACVVVEEVSVLLFFFFFFPNEEVCVRQYNLECLWESCGWYYFCAFVLPVDWVKFSKEYAIGSPVIPGSVYSSRPLWILSVINFLNFHGCVCAVRSSLAVLDLGLNAPTSVIQSQAKSPILKFCISSFHFLCLIFCPTSFQWA